MTIQKHAEDRPIAIMADRAAIITKLILCFIAGVESAFVLVRVLEST
jgi:hypothetical protein